MFMKLLHWFHLYLFIIVDLQSWEKKIAEEKELEYDNEEDVEIEEKIIVSFSFAFNTVFNFIRYYVLSIANCSLHYENYWLSTAIPQTLPTV